jgi:hypothetical protein
MDYVRWEVEERKLVEAAIDPDDTKGFGTSRKTASVSLFSPKCLVILWAGRASCKDVLCLGRNPNCSSHISPRSLTSCKILPNRIFSKIYQSCPRD